MDSKHVVRAADGSIDINASVSAFQNELVKMVSEKEISPQVLATAIDAVYDGREAGSRLSLQVLVSLVFADMSMNHTVSHPVLDKQVRAFVRNSPRFHSQVGIKGGTMRLYREGETVVAAPVKKTA